MHLFIYSFIYVLTLFKFVMYLFAAVGLQDVRPLRRFYIEKQRITTSRDFCRMRAPNSTHTGVGEYVDVHDCGHVQRWFFQWVFFNIDYICIHVFILHPIIYLFIYGYHFQQFIFEIS